MKPARLWPLAVAALLACLVRVGPALPGDKKNEALREKGEFTANTPKDKGKYTLIVEHDGKGQSANVKYLIDVKDRLTKDDKKDATRGNSCYCKTYKIEMKPKTTYIIELDSKDFDAYLRLENDEGKQVAYDDDGAGVGLNAKMVFTCDKAGTYTIFAT